MKKLIAFLVTFALSVSCTVSAYAFETEETVGAAAKRTITEGVKYTVPDQQGFFYTSNLSSSDARIEFKNLSTDKTTTVRFDEYIYHPGLVKFGTQTYSQMRWIKNSGGGGGGDINFSHTGGKYQAVKINLRSFLGDKFNKDGTYTKDGHTYNFRVQEEGDATYYSSLIFECGGAFTQTAPDKNGNVEIIVSREIGKSVYYSTEFGCKKPGSVSSGGGTNRGSVHGLTFGDADDSGWVSISDVTQIQLYCAGKEKFDDVNIRNADMDRDKKVDIKDATMLQIALAKMD